MAAVSEGSPSPRAARALAEDAGDDANSGAESGNRFETPAGSFDSGISGVDPTRRACSPASLNRAATQPATSRRFRAYQWLRGAVRRHKHGSTKHAVMAQTGMRSAARSGTQFALVSVIEKPGRKGFTIKVAATAGLRPLTQAMDLKQMVQWSFRKRRFDTNNARLVHEPAPVTQLAQALVGKSVRLGLTVIIPKCSSRFPWDPAAAAGVVAAATRAQAAAAARAEAAASAGDAHGAAAMEGNAGAAVRERGAGTAAAAVGNAGAAAAVGSEGAAAAVPEHGAAGAAPAEGSAAAANVQLILAGLVALEYSFWDPNRRWTNPLGQDWTKAELDALFKVLVQHMSLELREEWQRQIQEHFEDDEGVRLMIQSAINMVLDAGRSFNADAPCGTGVVTMNNKKYLPAVATHEDMLQVLAWGNFKSSLQQQGKCSITRKLVSLCDLHNAIVTLGGFKKAFSLDMGAEFKSKMRAINVNVADSNWRSAVRARYTTYVAPFVKDPDDEDVVLDEGATLEGAAEAELEAEVETPAEAAEAAAAAEEEMEAQSEAAEAEAQAEELVDAAADAQAERQAAAAEAPVAALAIAALAAAHAATANASHMVSDAAPATKEETALVDVPRTVVGGNSLQAAQEVGSIPAAHSAPLDGSLPVSPIEGVAASTAAGLRGVPASAGSSPPPRAAESAASKDQYICSWSRSFAGCLWEHETGHPFAVQPCPGPTAAGQDGCGGKGTVHHLCVNQEGRADEDSVCVDCAILLGWAVSLRAEVSSAEDAAVEGMAVDDTGATEGEEVKPEQHEVGGMGLNPSRNAKRRRGIAPASEIVVLEKRSRQTRYSHQTWEDS